MYDIEGDLTAIQNILIVDPTVLSLLGLTGKPKLDIVKRIIKRSQWNDIVGSDKRLGIYPLPARGTRSESLYEQMLEVACHVPISEDFKARKTISRAIGIINNTRIKGRYLKLRGLPGELPTMPGFYCFGCRLGYYDPI